MKIFLCQRQGIFSVRSQLRSLVFLLCLALIIPIFGQKKAEQEQHFVEEQDTLGLEYKYVNVNDIYLHKDAIDSLETPLFLSSVYQSGKSNYINTSNYGSSILPLYWNMSGVTGFSTGYRQYEPYQIDKKTFRFYLQNRPVTNLFFSQLGSQDNISVGADFSRNFANGLSISLNYKRLSQQGFYNQQATKSTAFGIGLRYESHSKKYNAILLFIQNANEERFNGGILADSLLSDRFRKAIPTLLNDAAGRQQKQSLSFIQYYRLNKTISQNWNLYLSNDLSYQPEYFKYWDKNLDSISVAYYTLPASVAIPAGIRRYTNIKKYSEAFYIHGQNNGGIQGKLGIVYDYFVVSDTPTSFKRSDMTAIAEGRIPFLKVLQIDAKGKLGLLKNIGTFDLSGDVGINVGKIGTLSGGIRFFRIEPTYNETRLNINGITILDTSFTNPFGTTLNATLTIPKIHFRVSVRQSIVNNPVYWNNTGRPAQFDGIFTIAQLDAHHQLIFKHFGFENDVYLQIQGHTINPLPKFFSTHKIYYKGIWFNQAMEMKIGFDGRLLPSYNGPAFQPLYDSYHLSDTTLPFAPEVNLFIQAKVSSFRALLSIENFSRYWVKTHLYNVAGYPVFDPTFRFGIQWMLKD
jgi:hypothetical protein